MGKYLYASNCPIRPILHGSSRHLDFGTRLRELSKIVNVIDLLPFSQKDNLTDKRLVRRPTHIFARPTDGWRGSRSAPPPPRRCVLVYVAQYEHV